MLKNLVQFEIVIDGKVCRLLCDSDTPLSSIKEFNFQVSKFVGQIEDNVKAQAEAAKAQEEKPVEV